MDSFDRLTHLGKGRRLRPLVHDVLRRAGIEDASVVQFRETSNMVFRVKTRSGERYVLRMTPPWHFHGAEDVRSEISWMQSIQSETDIGLPTPIANLDGEYVVTATRPDIPGKWHCVRSCTSFRAL